MSQNPPSASGDAIVLLSDSEGPVEDRPHAKRIYSDGDSSPTNRPSVSGASPSKKRRLSPPTSSPLKRPHVAAPSSASGAGATAALREKGDGRDETTANRESPPRESQHPTHATPGPNPSIPSKEKPHTPDINLPETRQPIPEKPKLPTPNPSPDRPTGDNQPHSKPLAEKSAVADATAANPTTRAIEEESRPNDASATAHPPDQVPPSTSAGVDKKTDVQSPSARRRSPPKPSQQAKDDNAANYPDSDEEEAPLDLSTISSYEYEQVAKLNPVQLRRYEQYRRSDLKNAKVRRLIVAINPTSKPSDQYIIAVKGLAKLFVGDVIEAALEVKKAVGDKGALQPRHIREAYRRLRRKGAVPSDNQNSQSLQ